MALSALVKKLLFARQFEIDKGRVKMLGMRKMIVSPEVIKECMAAKNGVIYSASKKALKKDTLHLQDDMGVKGKRLLDFSIQLMEAYGVGDVEITHLEIKNKKASFTVKDSVFVKSCDFTAGAIAGVLSVLFKGDVDVVETKCSKQGCRFEVKT